MGLEYLLVGMRRILFSRAGSSFIGRFFAMSSLVACGLLIDDSIHLHAQVSHSFECSAKAGLEFNPFHATYLDTDFSFVSFSQPPSIISPLNTWNGAYSGRWQGAAGRAQWGLNGETILSPRPELSPRRGIQGFGDFQKTLNPWLDWSIGWKGGYKSEIMQHWRALEQWNMLSIWSGHVQTKIDWRGDKNVGDVVIQRGMERYQSELGMGGDVFLMSSSWSKSLYKRVRGRMHLDLVNQKRTQDAGTVFFKATYAQKLFDDWMLSEGPVRFQLKGASWQSDRMDVHLNSPRLWHVAETTGSYRLPVRSYGSLQIDFGAKERKDVGSGAYDERSWGAGAEVQIYQAGWKVEANLQWWNNRLLQQEIWTESGWRDYQYHRVQAEFHAEKLWRRNLVTTLDVIGDLQRSESLPMGPYHRQSWNAGSIQIGLIWIAHSQSQWSRSLRN